MADLREYIRKQERMEGRMPNPTTCGFNEYLIIFFPDDMTVWDMLHKPRKGEGAVILTYQRIFGEWVFVKYERQ